MGTSSRSGARPLAEPRHDLQRLPVYGTQFVQFVLVDRDEQLIEPGKAQLGLELHPGGAQRPGCRRRSRIGRRVRQHRLASARFTTQQQCRAFGSSPIKDCADQRVLTAASDQKRRLSKSFQRGQPRREAGSPAYERTPPALAGRYLGAVLLEEPGHARIPPLRSRSTVADGDGYPANPGGGAWRQRDGRLSAAGYHDVAEPVRAA